MISWKKCSTALEKAVKINSKPTEETFPELPTVLIWLRFLLALTYGTFLGSNPTVQGWTVLLHQLNLIAFLPVMYCRLYLGVEGEHFGLQMIFSGTFQALALSLLIWMYFYTLHHELQEGKLASMLMTSDGGLMSDNSGAEMDEPVVAVPEQEDSEF